MFLSYNFIFIAEQDFKLSYLNRSFQYNDGFFETLLLDKGKIRFLSDHLNRIQAGFTALNFDDIEELNNPEKLENYMLQLAAKNGYLKDQTIRIKINFWRKPGGLFTPETNEAESLISLSPQAELSPIISHADFIQNIYTHYSPWSFLKGPNAMLYVQAGIAKKKAGLDDVILTDAAGNIAECLTSNIFWIKDNIIYTPALETGCIAGILRVNILRACAALNINIQEGFYAKQDILAAETVFTTNVTGLRSIKNIQEHTFRTSHPILNKLQNYIFI